MNKIIRLGSIFFAIVLVLYSALKYYSGNGKGAVYYIIAAAGFLIIALSYWKKEQK